MIGSNSLLNQGDFSNNTHLVNGILGEAVSVTRDPSTGDWIGSIVTGGFKACGSYTIVLNPLFDFNTPEDIYHWNIWDNWYAEIGSGGWEPHLRYTPTPGWNEYDLAEPPQTVYSDSIENNVGMVMTNPTNYWKTVVVPNAYPDQGTTNAPFTCGPFYSYDSYPMTVVNINSVYDTHNQCYHDTVKIQGIIWKATPESFGTMMTETMVEAGFGASWFPPQEGFKACSSGWYPWYSPDSSHERAGLPTFIRIHGDQNRPADPNNGYLGPTHRSTIYGAPKTGDRIHFLVGIGNPNDSYPAMGGTRYYKCYPYDSDGNAMTITYGMDQIVTIEELRIENLDNNLIDMKIS